MANWWDSFTGGSSGSGVSGNQRMTADAGSPLGGPVSPGGYPDLTSSAFNDWSKQTGWGKRNVGSNVMNGLAMYETPYLQNQYKFMLGQQQNQQNDILRNLAALRQSQNWLNQNRQGLQGMMTNTMRGAVDQQKYLQSQEPQRRSMLQSQSQTGLNAAKANTLGARLAAARSNAAGMMSQATEQGQAQAAQLQRAGLGRSAQLGAMLGSQNNAQAQGNLGQLAAMSPLSQQQALNAQAQGYGVASDAYGHMNDYGQSLANLANLYSSAYNAGNTSNADAQNLAAMAQAYGLSQPDLSRLLQMQQGKQSAEQVNASYAARNQGMNWGGLLGSLGSLASMGGAGGFGWWGK